MFWLFIFHFFALLHAAPNHTKLAPQEGEWKFEQGGKIALLTVVIGDAYSKTVEFGTWSKKIYCEKQGYDLIVATDHINEANGFKSQFKRHPSWTKISLAAKYLHKYDYIFFCDADAIIMNPTIPVESIIQSNPLDSDILICARDLRFPHRTINAGVWVLKNSEGSHVFLQQVWETGENEKMAVQANWEQGAMVAVLTNSWNTEERFPLNVQFLPSHIMNSKAFVDCYKPGDFIVHFCQIHGAELKKQFQKFTDLYYEENGRSQEFQPLPTIESNRHQKKKPTINN